MVRVARGQEVIEGAMQVIANSSGGFNVAIRNEFGANR
jgi:hypothetical protein